MAKLAIVIASFLALLNIAVGAIQTCHSAEDLTPCNCKRMAYGLHIVCANISDNSVLIRVFNVLREGPIQNILLHGLRLNEALPSDLFDRLDISELRIVNSKLWFSQPAFIGLEETLKVLNVANSAFQSSGNFFLAELNKLIELNFKSNLIDKVKDQWLNGKIPNVQNIVLEENSITEIESNAFANLQHLKSISLAENRIKTLKRSMFPRKAAVLTKIDFSGNEIKTLPYDFFYEMPELKEVILSGNDIETLPETTWTSVWEQLDTVLLIENNLVCDENLNWIKKLRWPDQVIGTCVAPSSMVGKTLKDVYNT